RMQPPSSANSLRTRRAANLGSRSSVDGKCCLIFSSSIVIDATPDSPQIRRLQGAARGAGGTEVPSMIVPAWVKIQARVWSRSAIHFDRVSSQTNTRNTTTAIAPIRYFSHGRWVIELIRRLQQ